ncbi:hypothetical protein BDW71DRAFT_151219 [Aspergillus fruticulosus]
MGSDWSEPSASSRGLARSYSGLGLLDSAFKSTGICEALHRFFCSSRLFSLDILSVVYRSNRTTGKRFEPTRPCWAGRVTWFLRSRSWLQSQSPRHPSLAPIQQSSHLSQSDPRKTWQSSAVRLMHAVVFLLPNQKSAASSLLMILIIKSCFV